MSRPEAETNPLMSFDARDWARELLRIHGGKTIGKDFDEGAAIGWFANALMRGYDERAWQVSQELLPPPQPERPMLTRADMVVFAIATLMLAAAGVAVWGLL